MASLIFLLKQMLPLKYETTVRVTQNGGTFIKLRTTWRMWFFKQFHIKTHEIE